MEQPKELQIENMWQDFLSKSNLEEKKMPEIQVKEMKRAFMAGVASLLIVQQDVLSELPEDQGVQCLSNLWNELALFWQSQLAISIEMI